jgi:5-methylcytosine-specific restriction endonuclease McrA
VLQLGKHQSLHLVLGSPPRKALASFLADGGRNELWRSGAFRKGDLLLTLLDDRPRKLLSLERAGADSRPDGNISVSEVQPLVGIFAKAVEARLGRSLPRVPSRVPDELAGLVLAAIDTELNDPTPPEVTEGQRCRSTSRKRSTGLQDDVLHRSGGFCAGCGTNFLDLFGGRGLEALEVHHLDPLSESPTERVHTASDRLKAVCGACHNLLHSSPKFTLKELQETWRRQPERDGHLFNLETLIGMLSYRVSDFPEMSALDAPVRFVLSALMRAIDDGTADIHLVAVPDAGASWDDIQPFALTYDGYGRHGGFDGLQRIGTGAVEAWARECAPPATLEVARAALYYEQRRWRMQGDDPHEEEMQYIRALVLTISRLSDGVVVAERGW